MRITKLFSILLILVSVLLFQSCDKEECAIRTCDPDVSFDDSFCMRCDELTSTCIKNGIVNPLCVEDMIAQGNALCTGSDVIPNGALVDICNNDVYYCP